MGKELGSIGVGLPTEQMEPQIHLVEVVAKRLDLEAVVGKRAVDQVAILVLIRIKMLTLKATVPIRVVARVIAPVIAVLPVKVNTTMV